MKTFLIGVYIRLYGDDMDPDDISQKLSVKAHDSFRKGDEHVHLPSGRVYVPRKTGYWELSLTFDEGINLTDPIDRMLEILGPIDIDLMSLSGVEEGISEMVRNLATTSGFSLQLSRLNSRSDCPRVLNLID